jgi:hypothetical protein
VALDGYGGEASPQLFDNNLAQLIPSDVKELQAGKVRRGQQRPDVSVRQAEIREGEFAQPGSLRATGVSRSSWLRKSRAQRPCCQHVRHTDISTACARAPAQVRLPPQTLRRMTPKRMASSARQLVASSPG